MDVVTAIAEAGGLTGVAAVVSKPACALLEKVSNAMGILYEPKRIVNVANAEAQADKIRAAARFEISEIEQRALLRLVKEQGKQQENIESITAKAIDGLTPEASPEQIEDDFVTHLFDRCRLVSDSDMQSMWAKILAGEANRKGAFAKQTVDILATLGKEDAELFTALCAFTCYVNTDFQAVPLIFDFNHQIYKGRGLGYTSLTHLDNLGLIRFNTASWSARSFVPLDELV